MTDSTAALDIIDSPLVEALGDRYLSYALSTIMSRSLPDVRDGLKPVHRRLLYAMRKLKLSPTLAPKKSARVVGDVIGQYHPHGDQSIYDALVRLAQDFAARYPLVDGQGNFGNIDGDSAAAMRYTEARLTALAESLLEGIDENAVDFRPTYDGGTEEPVVLPAAIPNILANGATGIAVGMATSIPPHNIGELCDACIHLIKHPESTIDKLIDYIPGPDFPTGGTLVEDRATIVKAYETGKGSFRIRAKIHREELTRGQWQLVVTEIPYMVAKSKLVERIADLMVQKKLPFLDDIIDESAEDIRIVLVPKSKNVEENALREALYKNTDLESRFSLNLNVLNKYNVPSVMNIREVLQAFLEHRKEVLERQTQFRLDQIAHRLEVLSGYMIAFLNLDEVIRIIREEDQPKQELIKTFKLTDVQAEAILNMRLRSLRKLEEMELKTEYDALEKEQDLLNALMASDDLKAKKIASQLREMKIKFGKATEEGRRRTEIGSAPTAEMISIEALVEKEPVTILLSEQGWVRTLKGHQEDTSDAKYKEGDRARFSIPAYTTDKLVLFATNGRFFTVGVDKLPGGRGFGEPIRLSVDLGNDVDIIEAFIHRPEGWMIVAATDGRGFKIAEKDVIAQTKNGKQVLNVSGDVEAALCTFIPLPEKASEEQDPIKAGQESAASSEPDMIAVIGNNRKLLVFPLEEVPVLTRGRGVILQKYKDASLSDIAVFNSSVGFSWKYGGGVRTQENWQPWLGKRANVGCLPPNGFPRRNKFH